MTYLVEERGDVVVVSPRGELDADSAGDFQNQVDELLKAGWRYFVVDLHKVSFVDSSGLSVLVRLYKRVRIGEGDVHLVQGPSNVMKILELTRLNRVFDIFPTAEEAATSIKQQD